MPSTPDDEDSLIDRLERCAARSTDPEAVLAMRDAAAILATLRRRLEGLALSAAAIMAEGA